MPEKFNTAEDQAVELNKAEELADNQVKLSDGRVVEMRESTGADEMVVAAELGDKFEANGSGGVIFMTCMIAKTVVSIDRKPLPSLRKFGEYRDFAGQFKSKDWNKIRNLYQKLNGDEGNE